MENKLFRISYKFVLFVISFSIVLLNYPFYFIKGEEEFIEIPLDHVNAYRYWTLYGFDLNVKNETITSTSNLSFSTTGTNQYSGTENYNLTTNVDQLIYQGYEGINTAYLQCNKYSNNDNYACRWQYNTPGVITQTGNYIEGGGTVNAHNEYTSGTVTHSEKVTVNETNTGTITNTDTYKLTYHLPILSATSTSNNSEYTKAQDIAVYIGQTYIISFMVNKNMASDPVIYYSPNSSANVNVNRLKREYVGDGWYKYTFGFEYDSSSGISNFSVRWPGLNNTYKIIPIYNGEISTMKDDLKVFCGLETDTNKLLRQLIEVTTNGNSNSQASISSADQQKSNLDSTSDNYHQLESTFNDDMNSNFNNIDLTANKGLIRNSKFGSSSRWVTRQFNRIVTDTPFELLITYSLTVGLALLVVGKLRR